MSEKDVPVGSKAHGQAKQTSKKNPTNKDKYVKGGTKRPSEEKGFWVRG